jgi:hypothetical protein
MPHALLRRARPLAAFGSAGTAAINYGPSIIPQFYPAWQDWA